MKSLKYFEKIAFDMKRAGFMMSYSDTVLSLMQWYRKNNGISLEEYKPIYDEWYKKYHN